MRTRARFLAFASLTMSAVLLLGASPAPEVTASPVVSPVPIGIIDVVISPNPVQSGKDVSLTVHTTPNAVQLQGHVLGHEFTLPKTGEGLFYGAGKIPWWARFFHGSLKVMFVAKDESGAAAQMEQTIRM